MRPRCEIDVLAEWKRMGNPLKKVTGKGETVSRLNNLSLEFAW